MSDMNYVHLLALLLHAENYTIDVRFVTVEQMPDIRFLTRHRAPVWMLFDAEDGLFKAPVPFEGGVGVLGVDFFEERRKIALRTGTEVNVVCHAGLRIRRKTRLPAGLCPP